MAPPEKFEKYPAVGYGLIETFKHLREIVGRYEFDRTQPATEAAAEYVLTRLSGEGDFRGFYADQYTPHYTRLLVELLVKAGYDGDPWVEEEVRWLIRVRQEDGGWVYSGLTKGLSWKEEVFISSHYAETLRFDPRHPSSHKIQGWRRMPSPATQSTPTRPKQEGPVSCLPLDSFSPTPTTRTTPPTTG